MRVHYPQLWMRVHSLPDSKRYPESQEERDEIFRRYSAFGTALLGNEAPCLFVRSRFATEELGAEFDPRLSWSRLYKIQEEGGEANDYWCSWAAEVRWAPHDLRGLLMDIAEDRDAHVLFISNESDSIFAPYDGGADGFSFDSGLIDRLKNEFQPWRSARTDGL